MLIFRIMISILDWLIYPETNTNEKPSQVIYRFRTIENWIIHRRQQNKFTSLKRRSLKISKRLVIYRFVSDKNRTVIANKFAKLELKSSTEKCTFVPDAGALFNRFIAPTIDESVLNFFERLYKPPKYFGYKESEL